MRPRYSRPRSSISANTRSARPRSTWRAPGCRCGLIRKRFFLSPPDAGDGTNGVDRYLHGHCRLDPAIPAAFVAAIRLPMSTFTIHDLELRLKDRAVASADVSYTRKLLDRGITHCAKKLGEEAIETALAAVGEDRERLAEEAADLIYHLLVVLNARGITLAEVEAVLAERTRQSGLDEKASRTRG